jgi:hypothetical protein
MLKPLRLSIVVSALAVAALVFAPSASAVSPHLKGGVKNNPAFTDNGLTLTAVVSYAGLGNFDTLQSLTATANATADCVNPGSGEHRPPGQNPAPVTVSGGTAVPKEEIDNGNVTISTTTLGPVTPIAGAPGCPNSNWVENITDLSFTSAKIEVFQDSNANGTFEPGELVITVNCTFSPATSNGAVPISGRTCTVS